LREYETTIIVQPEISDEGTAAIFERLDEVFTEHGTTRLLCENLGKRKLAYEIRKFHKGNYFILSFLSDGQVVPALERVLRLNESILRFMTIQTNPDVLDIDARKVEAAEAEAELTRKAEERAAREEEEAKARLEIERVAREEEEAKALAAAEAAEVAAAGAAEAAEGSEGETPNPAAAAAEPAVEETAASDAPESKKDEPAAQAESEAADSGEEESK
jgi:small subunit ribosomal protein S6